MVKPAVIVFGQDNPSLRVRYLSHEDERSGRGCEGSFIFRRKSTIRMRWLSLCCQRADQGPSVPVRGIPRIERCDVVERQIKEGAQNAWISRRHGPELSSDEFLKRRSLHQLGTQFLEAVQRVLIVLNNEVNVYLGAPAIAYGICQDVRSTRAMLIPCPPRESGTGNRHGSPSLEGCNQGLLSSRVSPWSLIM